MTRGIHPQEDQKIQELLNRKAYAEADALLAERLTRDARDPAALYLSGVSSYFQNKLGPTIKLLKETLEVDPRHTDAAICLSVLYNDLGRYDDAKRVFEMANQSVAHPRLGEDLSIDRKFALKHLELADMYFRYRRYDEAIEEYGKASMLDPVNLETRIRRAKALAKKGFLTRAMQELQQLKKENPRFVPARLQLGMLQYSQGNVLDAELEWEAVLDIEPDNREVHSYLEMLRQPHFRKGL